jgi:glycine/D-amino acid oxidase-like deaminating enzyme
MTTSDYLRDARIVVVGAGAIGVTLAYRLAQAGAQVTVVERRFPGAGTSGSTFAYVNGTDKPPRAYHRLNILSIRDHEDLADEIGGDWLHVTGSLHWAAAGDEARTTALGQVMRRLLAWGMRVDRCSPEQAMRELEPDAWIDPEAVTAVFLVHRAGWLDPVAMTSGVLRAAIDRYGAQLVRAEVVGLRSASGLVERVALDDGHELRADVVVNAAGPDGGRIAAFAGISLPLERTPGLLIVTAPAPARLWHVVYGPGVNLRPDGGARMMVQPESLDSHAVEGSPLPVEDPLVQDGLERARAVVPALIHVGVEAVRLGVRPMPRDGLPLVGFDPRVANLYHVVTHSGITLAARLALLVTEELTGGDTAPLEAYRPARFGGDDGAGSVAQWPAAGASD